MTQNLFLYWQRLTHRAGDEADRAEAPVLDLAGCFGSPVIRAPMFRNPGPPAIVAKLADAAPARPAAR